MNWSGWVARLAMCTRSLRVTQRPSPPSPPRPLAWLAHRRCRRSKKILTTRSMAGARHLAHQVRYWNSDSSSWWKRLTTRCRAVPSSDPCPSRSTRSREPAIFRARARGQQGEA